jgi:hypothetical protein
MYSDVADSRRAFSLALNSGTASTRGNGFALGRCGDLEGDVRFCRLRVPISF